ncbi:MAG: RluA family pseudouridine synthase, partial [Spirochaetales bacterium]|nr:RluA family pseudouridine synthase [Spirochaetales bacterium]
SRSNLKKRIEKLYVNGEPSKISRKVLSGDVIEYDLTKEESKDIKAEKIELDIIYEDSNVFVINKPAGMVVHPAAGNYSGTMAQGIKYLLEKDETDFSEDDIRPGIVHRLDKDTSGIIIAAKNTAALNFLSAQFRNREASKTYLAIINGVPEQNKGRIETLIGRDKNNRKKMTWKTNTGKEAVTEYKVLSSYGDKSFMALSPKTGRTHQLRVHMLSMKMPIVGDPLYSRQKDDSGLMLHAYKLRIKLPGEDSIREFRVPVADRFKDMLCELSATYLK